MTEPWRVHKNGANFDVLCPTNPDRIVLASWPLVDNKIKLPFKEPPNCPCCLVPITSKPLRFYVANCAYAFEGMTEMGRRQTGRGEALELKCLLTNVDQFEEITFTIHEKLNRLSPKDIDVSNSNGNSEVEEIMCNLCKKNFQQDQVKTILQKSFCVSCSQIVQQRLAQKMALSDPDRTNGNRNDENILNSNSRETINENEYGSNRTSDINNQTSTQFQPLNQQTAQYVIPNTISLNQHQSPQTQFYTQPIPMQSPNFMTNSMNQHLFMNSPNSPPNSFQSPSSPRSPVLQHRNSNNSSTLPCGFCKAEFQEDKLYEIRDRNFCLNCSKTVLLKIKEKSNDEFLLEAKLNEMDRNSPIKESLLARRQERQGGVVWEKKIQKEEEENESEEEEEEENNNYHNEQLNKNKCASCQKGNEKLFPIKDRLFCGPCAKVLVQRLKEKNDIEKKINMEKEQQAEKERREKEREEAAEREREASIAEMEQLDIEEEQEEIKRRDEIQKERELKKQNLIRKEKERIESLAKEQKLREERLREEKEREEREKEEEEREVQSQIEAEKEKTKKMLLEKMRLQKQQHLDALEEIRKKNELARQSLEKEETEKKEEEKKITRSSERKRIDRESISEIGKKTPPLPQIPQNQTLQVEEEEILDQILSNGDLEKLCERAPTRKKSTSQGIRAPPKQIPNIPTEPLKRNSSAELDKDSRESPGVKPKKSSRNKNREKEKEEEVEKSKERKVSRPNPAFTTSSSPRLEERKDSVPRSFNSANGLDKKERKSHRSGSGEDSKGNLLYLSLPTLPTLPTPSPIKETVETTEPDNRPISPRPIPIRSISPRVPISSSQSQLPTSTSTSNSPQPSNSPISTPRARGNSPHMRSPRTASPTVSSPTTKSCESDPSVDAIMFEIELAEKEALKKVQSLKKSTVPIDSLISSQADLELEELIKESNRELKNRNIPTTTRKISQNININSNPTQKATTSISTPSIITTPSISHMSPRGSGATSPPISPKTSKISGTANVELDDFEKELLGLMGKI